MNGALGGRRPPRFAFLAARVPEPCSPLTPSASELHEHLAEVLADLRFPVQRWQVVTAAELHGVDLRTLAHLRRLCATTYRDLATIVAEIAEAATESSRSPR